MIAPPERLAAFRILVGGYAAGDLAITSPSLLRPPSSWHPVGVARLLAHAPPAALEDALMIAAFALAILFALGWRFRVVAPALAALLLWVFTVRSSFGMVFHTENLVVLHVAILACAPAAAAWSLDARGRTPPPPHARFAWPLRLAAAVTALTYVLAAIAKLRIAGFAWLDGDQLRDQIAYDNLRRAVLGDPVSPLALPLLTHPWLFQALAVLTLIVELGAPLALVNQKIARGWAITAWGFHVGVAALMQIAFPYPLTAIAFAPLFALEVPVRTIRARRARARSAAA